MAYNYIDEKQLKDALHDSEEYMKPFFEPLAELERIGRGKPGRVAPGKPKVTTGLAAGMRRETPKQVIQQLPTGKVIIRKQRDLEELASGVLTDIILPNANSGGTPYDKAKTGIKDLYDNGSSWAYCFFNRRGTLTHADYRRVYVKDILFEKGKVSEFDSNYIMMIDWMTEGDIKAIIWQCEQQKKKSKERGETDDCKWDLKALRELLDGGGKAKDSENISSIDNTNSSGNDGYYKLVKCMQIGTGATFYTYAPSIDKVVMREVSKDPRGIIPLHGLIGEVDNANPIGEPLLTISAGKVNLLDFDMQNYQYGQGMMYDPALKKWGSTPDSKIRLAPGAIISMNGTRQTDDVEVMNLNNSAINNYANNASYITTQVYNEQGGSNDTSISGDAGAVGFSKTSAGVKQQTARTSISKDDLRRLYENWQGRIWETCLNIHFAESQGTKELELDDETMKRMKLDADPEMDYSKDFGKIRFTVAAGTSQGEDNDKESEKLIALQEAKTKYTQAGPPDEKFMRMYNQLVKNAGVDDPETLMYTDEEIELAKAKDEMGIKMAMKELEMQAQQMMNPAPEPMQEGVTPEPQAVQPNPAADDREMARQQLLERGVSEEEAEQMLMQIDQEGM